MINFLFCIKNNKNLERPLYQKFDRKIKRTFKLNRNKVELGKIICSNSGIIPSRIKFGLNIYSEKSKYSI